MANTDEIAQRLTVVIRKLRHELHVSNDEAHTILLKKIINETVDVLYDFSSGLEKNLNRVQQRIDILHNGVDMSKIDPLLKKASQDKRLRLTFADCSDLARQCAEARRRAGV